MLVWRYPVSILLLEAVSLAERLNQSADNRATNYPPKLSLKSVRPLSHLHLSRSGVLCKYGYRSRSGERRAHAAQLDQAVLKKEGRSDALQDLSQVSGRAEDRVSTFERETRGSRSGRAVGRRECDLRAGQKESEELSLLGADLLQAHAELDEQLDADQDHQIGLYLFIGRPALAQLSRSLELSLSLSSPIPCSSVLPFDLFCFVLFFY